MNSTSHICSYALVFRFCVVQVILVNEGFLGFVAFCKTYEKDAPQCLVWELCLRERLGSHFEEHVNLIWKRAAGTLRSIGKLCGKFLSENQRGG